MLSRSYWSSRGSSRPPGGRRKGREEMSRARFDNDKSIWVQIGSSSATLSQTTVAIQTESAVSSSDREYLTTHERPGPVGSFDTAKQSHKRAGATVFRVLDSSLDRPQGSRNQIVESHKPVRLAGRAARCRCRGCKTTAVVIRLDKIRLKGTPSTNSQNRFLPGDSSVPCIE